MDVRKERRARIVAKVMNDVMSKGPPVLAAFAGLVTPEMIEVAEYCYEITNQPKPIIAGANRDRQFGHTDPVSADHHGPESRWKKQARRRQRRRIGQTIAAAPVAKTGG